MNSVQTRKGLAIEPVEDGARGGAVVNRRIVLKRNPEGEPKPSDFEVVTEEVPPVAEGQMLLRTKWLTLDPYLRGLDASGPMNNERSVGSTIVGGTVSEVVASRARAWNEGDLVVGYYGWQEYNVGTPEDLQWGNEAMPIEKWDGSLGPPSTALGILGMTGYAAYAGLLNVATIKAGETVVVSAASGAGRAGRRAVGENPTAAGRSASPAGLGSALTSSTSSALTLASTTRPASFPPRWRRPCPTASTSTSRTLAATCSRQRSRARRTFQMSPVIGGTLVFPRRTTRP